jgi:hypothetical protein
VRHYATVCHARQLPVLLGSMRRHCGDFMLHVLAWDYDPWLMTEPEVVFTPRWKFLAAHPDLEPSRLPGPPRRPVDVVATVRWTWYADLMAEIGGPLTMLDGDVWLMSSPEPVFAEIGRAPMAVTPHRIPPHSRGLPGVTLETHGCYGRHNAGWVYAAIPQPIQEMAAATYLWSYTEVVERPGRRPLFGDQSALEDIAERYGAHEIAAPVNVGPWSAHNAPLARGMYADAVFYGGRELVAYHFSSLRLAPDGTPAQLANPCYEVERAPGAAELIYAPYLAAVRAAAGGRIKAS